MKKLGAMGIAILGIALGLTGCGGGGGYGRDGYAVSAPPPPPPRFTTEILSDPGLDGDIEQTTSSSFKVTQGMSPTVQSTFAGIDPVTLTEFRTFLDFPLTGAGGVPAFAFIDSAFLDISIKSIQPTTGTIPLRIELVSFPPTLLGTDFDRSLQPPLAVATLPIISRTDVGANISINVTPLMVVAQRLKLTDFKLRIMEDLGPGIATLVEIDDTTGSNREFRAPQLTVTYY